MVGFVNFRGVSSLIGLISSYQDDVIEHRDGDRPELPTRLTWGSRHLILRFEEWVHFYRRRWRKGVLQVKRYILDQSKIEKPFWTQRHRKA